MCKCYNQETKEVNMTKHRKPGRPPGSKTKYGKVYGCDDVTIYRRHNKRIQKVTGKKYKACF